MYALSHCFLQFEPITVTEAIDAALYGLNLGGDQLAMSFQSGQSSELEPWEAYAVDVTLNILGSVSKLTTSIPALEPC